MRATIMDTILFFIWFERAGDVEVPSLLNLYERQELLRQILAQSRCFPDVRDPGIPPIHESKSRQNPLSD